MTRHIASTNWRRFSFDLIIRLALLRVYKDHPYTTLTSRKGLMPCMRLIVDGNSYICPRLSKSSWCTQRPYTCATPTSRSSSRQIPQTRFISFAATPRSLVLGSGKYRKHVLSLLLELRGVGHHFVWHGPRPRTIGPRSSSPYVKEWRRRIMTFRDNY